MKQIKLRLLTDKLFLLGLMTLLTNDLILKYEVGGHITGKLSDISGLFIFPFFWSIFFERHRQTIYILTGLAFIFWKLPISSDIINTVNQTLGTKFQRVIDYTDLLTLLVLPISYNYLKRKIESFEQEEFKFRMTFIAISIISIFAFVATSLPRAVIKPKVEIGESYVVDVSKENLLTKVMEPATGLCDSLEANLIESLFVINFDTRYDFKATVKIYELEPQKTLIEFISMDTYTLTGGFFSGPNEEEQEKMKELNKEDFKKIFEREVINKIKNQEPATIYYWNPKLDPRIIEDN